MNYRMSCSAPILFLYIKNNCEKENYRPVSTLSIFFNVYEELIHNQLHDLFDTTLIQSQSQLKAVLAIDLM